MKNRSGGPINLMTAQLSYGMDGSENRKRVNRAAALRYAKQNSLATLNLSRVVGSWPQTSFAAVRFAPVQTRPSQLMLW